MLDCHHSMPLVGLPGAVSEIVTAPLGAAAMAAPTKAVLAICVVLVPAPAVGAVGVPVRAGEARSALRLSAVCCAVLTGLPASVVLSTLANPTAVLSSVAQTLVPFQYCAAVPAVIVGSLAARSVTRLVTSLCG